MMHKTGVVFSSGFFGFFAHAGFLAALRELKVEPAGYAGASSGAIVAAMAASGMSDSSIKEILLDLKKSDFWDPEPIPLLLRKALKGLKGYRGYLRGRKFCRLLEKIPVNRIEACSKPLAIVATNLTERGEGLFTKGPLIIRLQASGAVPMLFKPVEIDGSLYVDGGMVNKAPVLALADLIEPERIIVHFISSDNLEESRDSYLKKKLTPWHIYHLSVNISREVAYQRQCDLVRRRGVEIIQVRSNAPTLGPDSLNKGLSAYVMAKDNTLKILKDLASR
ncbi:MAG: patatin-like phospholipase family protein [Pseudomonadota bacterium]